MFYSRVLPDNLYIVMKRPSTNTNLFMRIIIIVFIAEQIIFMGFVIFKKGTSIIDYLSGLF